MSTNTTIIIPTIKINKLLTEIIFRILKYFPKTAINVVTNVTSDEFKNYDNVNIIQTDSKNMSKKRNIGVKNTNTEYIAFIDSDAYPNDNWITNGEKLLSDNEDYGIITGPELSFPDQLFIENIVGICNKSYLITGSHSFRKSLSSSRFYSEASSCNLFMRKKDFLMINGMNENLYLGEDRDLSERLIKNLKKKIFFSKESYIYHKDRNLFGFFFQRFARGEALNDSILSILRDIRSDPSIKNILKQRLELLAPILFIIFLMTFLILFIYKQWIYIYFPVITLFLLSILLNTLKLCKTKIYNYPFVFIFLIIGTITPGIAQFLKLLKINIDISKFYRNSNDI